MIVPLNYFEDQNNIPQMAETIKNLTQQIKLQKLLTQEMNTRILNIQEKLYVQENQRLLSLDRIQNKLSFTVERETVFSILDQQKNHIVSHLKQYLQNFNCAKTSDLEAKILRIQEILPQMQDNAIFNLKQLEQCIFNQLDDLQKKMSFFAEEIKLGNQNTKKSCQTMWNDISQLKNVQTPSVIQNLKRDYDCMKQSMEGMTKQYEKKFTKINDNQIIIQQKFTNKIEQIMITSNLNRKLFEGIGTELRKNYNGLDEKIFKDKIQIRQKIDHITKALAKVQQERIKISPNTLNSIQRVQKDYSTLEAKTPTNPKNLQLDQTQYFPIQNQSNLCALIAALHMTLNDNFRSKKLQGSKSKLLKLMGETMSKRDNSGTNIIEIAEIINKHRKNSKLQQWKIGQYNSAIEVLEYIQELTINHLNLEDNKAFPTLISKCSNCGVDKQQFHHIRIPVISITNKTSLNQLLKNYDSTQNCQSCLSIKKSQINNLPRSFYVFLEIGNLLQTDKLDLVFIPPFIEFKQQKYRITGSIQFNKTSQHYRTLRQLPTQEGFRWFELDTIAKQLKGNKPKQLNQGIGWHNNVIKLELVKERSQIKDNSKIETKEKSNISDQASINNEISMIDNLLQTSLVAEENIQIRPTTKLENRPILTRSKSTNRSTSKFKTVKFGKSNQPKLKWTLIHWNSNGLNTQKMKYIQLFDPYIACICEPRKQHSIAKYNLINSLPEINKQAKISCAIYSKENLSYITIGQDVNIVAIATHSPPINKSTLIICLYIHPRDTDRNEKTQDLCLQYINEFKRSINHKNHAIIICGDLNTEWHQIQTNKGQINQEFGNILKNMNRTTTQNTIKKNARTKNPKQIDYIFSSQPIDSLNDSRFISDHSLQISKFESHFQKSFQYYPNRYYANKITQQLLKQPQIDLQTLNKVKKQVNRTTKQKIKISNIPKFISTKNKLIQKKLDNHEYKDKAYFKQFKNTMQKLREHRYKQPKQFFQDLKKITKYNLFEKRDGQIIHQIIENNNIIQGNKMQQIIIEHYKQLHNRYQQTEQHQFPQLTITNKQVIKYMNSINKGKAITYDGISDQIMTLCNKCVSNNQYCPTCQKKITFCTNFFNKEYWNTNNTKTHCSSRLMALNKVYPKIPQKHQYRPIVILSPVIKLLEGHLKEPLKQYVKQLLPKNQYGFIPNTSIYECKAQVIQILNDRKNSKKETWTIFIDLSCAYDLVNRQKLDQILIQQNILNDSQLKLLRWLNTNITVQLGKHNTRCSNGVGQGSTIAPLLFAILSKKIIKPMITECDHINLYADDIILICNDIHQVEHCITKLRQTLNQLGLILNERKSAILPMWQKKSNINNILGIPIETHEFKEVNQAINPVNRTITVLDGIIPIRE